MFCTKFRISTAVIYLTIFLRALVSGNPVSSNDWDSVSRSERTKRAVVGNCQMTQNVVTVPVTTGLGKTLDQQVTLSLDDPSHRKPLLDSIKVFEINGEEIKDGSWKGTIFEVSDKSNRTKGLAQCIVETNGTCTCEVQKIIENGGKKMRLEKSGKASLYNSSHTYRATEGNKNVSLTFDEMTFDLSGTILLPHNSPLPAHPGGPPLPPPPPPPPPGRRKRQSTISRKTIRILVAVDDIIWARFLDHAGGDQLVAKMELFSEYNTIVRDMELMVLDLFPKITVKLLLAGYLVFTSLPYFFTTIDNSSQWQKLENRHLYDIYVYNRDVLRTKYKQYLPPFDALIFFTGRDLARFNGVSSWDYKELAGVSYTGSLGISPPHAISLLEDNYGYLVQLLAAHEFLHLVGARHDNLLGCNTNEIMSERVTSPTPSEPKNYWTVSSCTETDVNYFLQNRAQGLISKSSSERDQKYGYTNVDTQSLDAQCQNKYGKDSVSCTSNSTGSAICKYGITCSTIGSDCSRNTGTVNLVHAGTPCYPGYSCHRTQCVSNSEIRRYRCDICCRTTGQMNEGWDDCSGCTC